MATPSKSGKKLIEYNCKNGVYSLDGTTIKPLGYLASVTLDKNSSSDEKYGDGEVQLTLVNDRGSTGTLELTARDDEFEKDLEFAKKITQGLAEIQVLQNKTISIGFETYITLANGQTKTKKVWLLGVNVSPAGESLSQNTDSTNEATASYGITVKGVNLKNSAGTADYTDANGNTIKVFKISCLPTDTGYSTFLDSVPTPTQYTEVPRTVSITKDTHTSTVTIVDQNNNPVTTSANDGDVLTITATFAEGYQVDTFTINTEAFTNGGTYTVSGNVAIVITSKAIVQ